VKLVPRQPNIDADDNVGRGMDLALVTLLFFGLGYALDRWLDTRPVFMIVLTVLALVGKITGMWYQYDAKMKGLEAERLAGQHEAPRHTVVVDEEAPSGLVIAPGGLESGLDSGLDSGLEVEA
jgi:hypothetical protein